MNARPDLTNGSHRWRLLLLLARVPARFDGRRALVAGFGLALLMAATRFGHMGSRFNLPDATLAVFFAAGLVLPASRAFPLLCIEAFGIDALAFAFGTSAACVSTAYAFLLPTYGVMWLAGRYAQRLGSRRWLGAVLALSAAACVAFVISSGSFYLLSGSFEHPSLAEFARRASAYLPSYVSTALVYGACLIGLFAWLSGDLRMALRDAE
jgi:hypothetical protein